MRLLRIKWYELFSHASIVAMATVLKKEKADTYAADPGRMLMEEMCELEREETEGNIRMTNCMSFPTQHPYIITLMCHQGKMYHLAYISCVTYTVKKTWFFISCKGHRKCQECQEAGI